MKPATQHHSLECPLRPEALTRIAVLALVTSLASFGSVTVHAQSQWTPARTYPPTTSFQKVAFGNGRFVATASAAGLPVVLTSRDGLAWSDPLPAPAESDFDLHLKFVRDRFFLFQQEGVWTSTEGAAWTRFNLPQGFGPLRITHDGSRYVVVGEDAAGGGGSAFATSTNGLDWVVSSFHIFRFTFRDVAAFTNAETGWEGWRKTIAVTGAYNAKFSGDQGYILNLPRDEVGWWLMPATLAASAGGSQVAALHSISVDPYGTFVVAGDSNLGPFLGRLEEFYTGSDSRILSSWTRFDSRILSLAHGNGLFLALSGRTVLTSVDGVGWSREGTLPFDADSAAIAGGDGIFVVVAGNTAFYSTHDGRPRLGSLSNYGRWGSCECLSAVGLPGHTVAIESSVDLKEWHQVAFSISGRVDFENRDSSIWQWPRRFYRATQR